MKKVFRYFKLKPLAKRYRRLLLHFYILGLNQGLSTFQAKAKAQARVAVIIEIDGLRSFKQTVDYVWEVFSK